MGTLINILLTVFTVVLITLAVHRIRRDSNIYAEMRVSFYQWLHRFDDPETHD